MASNSYYDAESKKIIDTMLTVASLSIEKVDNKNIEMLYVS